MTYSTSGTYYFFVVGGDTAGTDSGRIYVCRKKSSNWILFDSSQNTEKYLYWAQEYWTTQNMIVLSGPSDSVPPTYYGCTDMIQLISLGFGGSILYDSVVTL